MHGEGAIQGGGWGTDEWSICPCIYLSIYLFPISTSVVHWLTRLATNPRIHVCIRGVVTPLIQLFILPSRWSINWYLRKPEEGKCGNPEVTVAMWPGIRRIIHQRLRGQRDGEKYPHHALVQHMPLALPVPDVRLLVCKFVFIYSCMWRYISWYEYIWLCIYLFYKSMDATMYVCIHHTL